MAVTGVVVRVPVDDIDAAVPFYEELVGASAQRFEFSGADLASIGPFLLFAARGEFGRLLRRVTATVTTDDLDGDSERLARLGAEVLAPPADTPNGRRTVIRHPDGSVFEYTGR